jgi:hypothetical protein
MTLLTAYEVVKYGPVEKDYPTAYICKHLKRTETKLFKKCFLGKAFYDALISDLKVTESVELFDNAETYDLGSLILYNDCILESLVSDNQVHPDDNDDLNPSWKIADKFKTPSNNILWEDYLREWLVLEVILTSLRYSTYKIGSKGTVKIIGDDTDIATVNHQEFAAMKKEIRFDADDALDNVYDYMVEETKAGSEAYTNIEKVANECGYDSTCSKPSRTRRRRFLFKN